MASSYNLLNNVISIATRMAAELGINQTKFTLDSIEVMRAKVRKDHWELLTELGRSDDLGRHLANSIVSNLFTLAFNNVRSARIFDSTTLEIVLDNETLLRIDNPAQRVQEEELPW